VKFQKAIVKEVCLYCVWLAETIGHLIVWHGVRRQPYRGLQFALGTQDTGKAVALRHARSASLRINRNQTIDLRMMEENRFLAARNLYFEVDLRLCAQADVGDGGARAGVAAWGGDFSVA